VKAIKSELRNAPWAIYTVLMFHITGLLNFECSFIDFHHFSLGQHQRKNYYYAMAHYFSYFELFLSLMV